jgi:hypothetical protein
VAQDQVPNRPDVVAAIRGGDAEQPMDHEQDIGTASLDQAQFWRATYREIADMEQSVMARVQELMASQSDAVRQEIELSNVPVIAAQLARFRARLGYWEARVQALADGEAEQVDKA